MNRDSATLRLIQASFPGREDLLEDAFRAPRFRELCQDYRRCEAALHRWQQLATAHSVLRSQEYSELLADLGREIETWLEAMDIAPSGRGTGVRQ